jgi:hypothetical protein
LLHKGNATDDLTNWRPISLLNVAYKIVAKALQRRLQPLLSEVISPDQTTFLPNRYILDNVLVLHESIAWAQETEQDMALFKLDFCKAYDTVHLSGLFKIMQTFGIPEHFLRMVQVLFSGATSSVNLNGGNSEVFDVQRGVRQGCPLAPYLFLFVGEALNIMSRRALELGELDGMMLPESVTEQVLLQYANDADLMVRGSERNSLCILSLLESYGLATGLRINWPKSQIYWISSDPPPPWLARLLCPWAVEGQLSKLLGTPFGVNLHTQDVDNFLLSKIQKKLDYWVSVHLSLSGRAIIANSVLLSTLYYFISLWGGSRQVIRKIRS